MQVRSLGEDARIQRGWRWEVPVTMSEDSVAPVLRARAVRVELPGAKSRVLRRRSGSLRALVGLDLQVLAGDTVWVVGETGEGANAVGRVLGGELAPTSGTVELAGRELVMVRGRRRPRSRRQLAWLGSESGSALDPKRTAVEVVAEAAAGSVRSVTSEHISRARDLLAQVDLDADSCEVRTSALSQDDRRLVAVARVVALQPRVVVYHQLWPSDLNGDIVWAALTGLRGQANTALVVVGERLPDSLGPAERALILCGGRVVEVLGPGDLEHPLHPFTLALRGGQTGTAPTTTAVGLSPKPPARASDEGCPFRSDCPRAKARCGTENPRLTRPLGSTHDVACHFPEDPRRRTRDASRVAGEEGVVGSGAVALAQSDEPTAREFAEG